jgi:hypothetical protein
MSQEEFQVMCSAFYAVYQQLIMIWSGAVIGVGILASVVLAIVMFFRRAIPQ